MSDQVNINQIGKALSDELRVRILTELSTKPPMRHTELLNLIGLEGAESNRLTYHLNILVEAGLIIKLDSHYKVSERGLEIYSSLSSTLGEWEELAYSDELKSLTGVQAVSLLLSDPLKVSGYMYASMGVLFYIFTKNLSFLLIIAVGALSLGTGFYFRPPETSLEDNKKIVKHITRLLGVNKLIPILIIETLNICTGVLLLIVLILDSGIVSMGFTAYATVGIILISLCVLIWLIKVMRQIWDSIKRETKPDDYHQSLLIIASTIIQFYLFSGFYVAWSILVDPRISNGLIWVLSSFAQSIMRVFKETYNTNPNI